MEDRYWPFDWPPVEQRSVLQQAQARFLESAHREGFCPFARGVYGFAAGSPDRRSGCIVVADENHWQLVLGERGERMLWGATADFDAAAMGVLRWLRGEGTKVIAAALARRLVRLPGLWYRYWLHGSHYQ